MWKQNLQNHPNHHSLIVLSCPFSRFHNLVFGSEDIGRASSRLMCPSQLPAKQKNLLLAGWAFQRPEGNGMFSDSIQAYHVSRCFSEDVRRRMWGHGAFSVVRYARTIQKEKLDLLLQELTRSPTFGSAKHPRKHFRQSRACAAFDTIFVLRVPPPFVLAKLFGSLRCDQSSDAMRQVFAETRRNPWKPNTSSREALETP